MGKKPSPKVLRSHKFKNVGSLLVRAHEKVMGGVFERPQWYDAYQRYPVDNTDVPEEMDDYLKELLQDAKETRVQYLVNGQSFLTVFVAKIPRSHPGQVLLDRMLARRPSFSMAIFDESGKPNMTQKYWNRMYQLLEEGLSENKAFMQCDSEFKTELKDYEKQLTLRKLSKEAKFGADVAHDFLLEAIEAKENEHLGTEITRVSGTKNGFIVGDKLYEPAPFDQKHISEYEKEVGLWYDRSKFGWAYDWEANVSRVLKMGITERELGNIQREMRFAINNPINQTADGIEANSFRMSLAIRKTGNSVEYIPGGLLKLDHHRMLCHLCLYAEEAQKRLDACLSSGLKAGEPPFETLKSSFINLRKDEEAKAILREGEISDKMAVYVTNLRDKAEEGKDVTGLSPLEAKVRAYNVLKGLVMEAELSEKETNKLDGKIRKACEIEPLKEELELRKFLETEIDRSDLCNFEGNGTLDVQSIKELQRMPLAMQDYVEYVEEVIEDLRHLQKQGDAPQTGRVSRCLGILQKVSDFMEEVDLHQFGRIITLEEILHARDLYRRTLQPNYNPKDEERKFMGTVWDDVEHLERFVLLNEGVMPTMTIKQFNRVAESPAFLSRLIPMQEPIPFSEDEDPEMDRLYECGYGRLSNPDIQNAIKMQMIFPARVRSFIYRGGRKTLRKVRPNFGGNKELQRKFAEDERNSVRYSAFGGKNIVEPMIMRETYHKMQESKKNMSATQDLKAQWALAEEHYNSKIKKSNQTEGTN